MTWQNSINAPVNIQGEFAVKRFYGDPQRAASYLPVAYALLGELKNQMALSEISYGHRMVELSDTTRIRVIRNFDQNILEIIVNSPSETSRSFMVGGHGFCFHPKTLSHLDGWTYIDEELVFNGTTFLLNYYFQNSLGLYTTDCFGAVYYSSISIEKHRRMIETYQVLFGVYRLSGNQFFYSGENVYSFFHSAGGDLPMLKEQNIWDIYRSLLVPFLRVFFYSAAALWTPLPDFPIPKTVFRDGVIRSIFNEFIIGVGVHKESEKEFAILTFQYREFAVSDMDGKKVYEEVIYPHNTQANFVLDRKAFIHPDGDRFAIISIHPTESKIHRYSVTVDEKNQLAVTKTDTTTLPGAKEVLTVTQTSFYEGESYRLGDFLRWYPLPGEPSVTYSGILQPFVVWLVLNKPEHVGDCLYARGRVEMPPDAETRNAGGFIKTVNSYSKVSKEPVSIIYDNDQERIIYYDYNYQSTSEREYQESSRFDYYFTFYSTFYPWIDCGGTQYLWQGRKTCNTTEENHSVITFTAKFTGASDDFIVAQRDETLDESATGYFTDFPDPDIGGTGNSVINQVESTYKRDNKEFEYIVDYFEFSSMVYIAMRKDTVQLNTSMLDYYFANYQMKPDEYRWEVTPTSMEEITLTYEAKFKNKDDLYTYHEFTDKLEPFFSQYYVLPAPDRAYAAGNNEKTTTTDTDLIPIFLDWATRNVTGTVTAAIDYRYESISGLNPFMYDIKFSPDHYLPGYAVNYYYHGDSFGGVVEKLPMGDVKHLFLHPIGLY